MSETLAFIIGFIVFSACATVYMCVDKIADAIKIKARLENGLDENGKMREEKSEIHVALKK